MNQQRKVAQLAKIDADKALRLASKIADPRERAIAFGWVARFEAPKSGLQAFEAACKSADATPDAYQGTTAMAWPLRALIETGRADKIAKRLKQALERAATIEPIASRAEALILLLQSVLPAGMPIAKPVVAALVAHCCRSTHWRAVRALQSGALLANALDRNCAERIALAIQNPNKQSTTIERLKTGETMSPRQFFW